MGIIKDLTGKRFGRLIVLRFLEKRNNYSYWVCACDCGEIAIVRGVSLSDGNTKGCGCTNWKHGNNRKGKTTPTYNTWQKMKERCQNPNHDKFMYYGGAGVSICERWRNSFINFLEDMGERPSGKTIDRIDPDGNYEPSNCRWATQAEQIHNRRKRNASMVTDI